MDNLLISDVICRDAWMFLFTTLMHRMMVLLPCMKQKLDVIKILNLDYVLCYLKSYYIKQTSKYFFLMSEPAPSISI